MGRTQRCEAMLAINSDKEVQDAALGYIDKHEIAPLLREVMEACLMSRPSAPLPFMLDCFLLGPGNAVQDQELGIAVWRKTELEALYGTIVQVCPCFLMFTLTSTNGT